MTYPIWNRRASQSDDYLLTDAVVRVKFPGEPAFEYSTQSEPRLLIGVTTGGFAKSGARASPGSQDLEVSCHCP